MSEIEKAIEYFNVETDKLHEKRIYDERYVNFMLATQALQEKRDRENPADGWISINDMLPQPEQVVLITIKDKTFSSAKSYVSTAAHVGYHEKSTEDWREYEGDTEYDEENDCYWIRPCWYEVNIVDDNPNWELSDDLYEITHWMPLPAKAE